ncbi:MAG: T9SS type A sorting domain-containing protein [Bacteroidales bacterium]|nr:T9SS type A sorting domain-containing protein [Bacteroidales bacterium]
MRIILLILFIFSLSFLNAQDTLRVMHYNLLYYGNGGFCTSSNNNTDLKDAYLRTIVAYSKPDIFTVNELRKESSYHIRILDDVMNQAGSIFYEMAESPNLAGSIIVNQLYFNTEKLVLHSQEVAQDSIRDIDIYSLYALNEGLLNGDTVFIHCIVAHLKAGDNGTDRDKREAMVQNTLDYLEAYGKTGNYLFMGDFNFYKSSEAGFQLMINNIDPVFRFYDPVDEIGSWHNSSVYRHVHSQSTRTAQTGCGAWGGMDDRFDFILMNKVLHDEADNMYYLEGSYRALGQDGQRLNGSLLDPPNTSLPAYVLDALIGMSDHLPVIMDLVINDELSIVDPRLSIVDVRYNNPVRDELKLRFSNTAAGPADIMLLSTSGVAIYREHFSLSRNGIVSIPLDRFPAGMYFLRVEAEEGSFIGKVIVIR